MVSKLEKKFEGVKREVRVARDRILREAAADLHQLRSGGSVNFSPPYCKLLNARTRQFVPL